MLARVVRRGVGGVLLLLVAACGGPEEAVVAPPSPAASGGFTIEDPSSEGASEPAFDPVLDGALSTPREDSVYPDAGDPGVDALHYDLDLSWDRDTRTLDGVATIVLRSTRDADELRLDLGEALDVSSVRVDDRPVGHTHEGKDLLVGTPVTLDGRYVVRVAYSGTPVPVAAPTTRSDVSTLGLSVTDDAQVWTMQEPFGAFTWYPVNDQPADKAFYDVTVHAPGDWVGVSNGELVERRTEDGGTLTRWHLGEPAASYLMTLAIGAYDATEDVSASGVPITYWTPTDRPALLDGLRSTPAALAWLEERLGPYPFDTLGIVLVDSLSGMETQTMLTLGISDYTTSPAVIVHELAHQWYGDRVTPDDWRDVWMSEGMAMYLQSLWQSENEGIDYLRLLAQREPRERAADGPPAAYDPATFGQSNIYYGPALMWRALRERVGDERFLRLVRRWPQARDDTSTGREDYLGWLQERTGVPASFFDDWLLSPISPLT